MTDWFEPNFTDDMEENSEEFVSVDTLCCSECKGEFEVPPDDDPERCPLCNVPFDGLGN